MSNLSAYVGGKTGTSEDENDAWFVGFTNDVTIGVWVGYDNADGRRRTLGDGQTGGRVSVPIFGRIVEATWADFSRKTPLNVASPEAKKELVAVQIDLNSGNRLSERTSRGFTEYLRMRNGHLDDTQYLLVSPDEAVAARDPDDDDAGSAAGGERNRSYYAGTASGGNQGYGNGSYGNGLSGGGYAPSYQQPRGFFQGGGIFGGLFGQPAPQTQVQRPVYPQAQVQRPAYPNQQQGLFGETRPRYSEDRRWAPPRRYDPDVPWRDR